VEIMQWTQILYRLPSHYLEDRANQILDELIIQSPEDLKLRRVARHFEIPVYYMPENSSAMRFGEKYLIIVDNRLIHEERRERLAEEICHCLLPMGNQLYQNERETNRQEGLALKMAAYLLMPRRFILDLSIPEDETLAVELLAGVFKVTPDLIRYRFGLDYQRWLGYINKTNIFSLGVVETKADYD
jgi:Zn-dependent peptidase ImmA (M78 family)